MRFNLGCGFDYRRGWVNVDRFAGCGPDLVHDLLEVPWPIADESADEILLSLVLEEIALTQAGLMAFVQELYRISRPGCVVRITMLDPTATDGAFRAPLTAKFVESLDLAANETWIGDGAAATPHAAQLQVDFAVQGVTRFLEPDWLERFQSGSLGQTELDQAIRSQNNVVRSLDLVLTARKPFRPGRALEKHGALVVRRIGGLGDVLMALSALKAVKRAVGLPIFVETGRDYAAFCRLCPHVDAVFTSQEDILAHLNRAGISGIRYVDWSAVKYGISHRHETDAFLLSLGLVLPGPDKGLDIVLPPQPAFAEIDRRLATLPEGRRRVVLHPGVSDPNRTWPAAFWTELARHARACGHAVLTIGRNHGTDGKGALALSGDDVLAFADTLDLAGSLYLLRRCDMLVSGDAGPIQLAGAADIAVVGLYSTVAGHCRLPYRNGSTTHKAVALAPACPFHPCYEAITNRDFVERFCREEHVAPEDLNALFGRWCLNPDRYACTRDEGVLARAKAAIAGLS